MIRPLSPCLVLLALAIAPVAESQTQTLSGLPVIGAGVSGNDLIVRLTRGVTGHTPGTRVRLLHVQAMDFSGTVIEERVVVVDKRLTYATIPLSAVMRSASRLVVTGD